jgi:Arc/MetJ-type ribon-helix-helix transcriptional regulator
MSYAFPPRLEHLVREQLATGAYNSEDELLLEALTALHDRDEAIAGIQEGISDFEAGRVRPLDAVDSELQTKYAIPGQE